MDSYELISLALTPATIILAMMVVFFFGRKIRSSQGFTDREWLLLGVSIHFLGSLIDNSYWGVAWSAAYLSLESKSFWFENGVIANIPFRQIAGIAAAYCHLRAALRAKFVARLMILMVWVTILTGVVYRMLQ